MISPGQKRVKEIAYEVLEKYAIDPMTVRNSKHPAYQALPEMIAQDEIIKNDPLTGCKVSDVKDACPAYIEWVKSNSTMVQNSSAVNFSFNRMVFGGSADNYLSPDGPSRRIFECGSRQEVTAWAILTLAKGEVPNSKEIVIRHYIKSGLTLVDDGNHRMLAQKLMGKLNLPMDKVTFYKEPDHDCSLNEALSFLEKIDPKIALNIPPDTAIQIASWLKQHPRLCQFISFDIEQANKKNGKSHRGSFTTAKDKIGVDEIERYLNAYQTLIASKNNTFWQGYKPVSKSSKPENIMEKSDNDLLEKMEYWLKNKGHNPTSVQ